MLQKYKAVLAAFTLTTALALSGCAASGESSASAKGTDSATAELVQVKMIKFSAASDNYAMSLGHEEGIFAKHGIELDFIDAPQVGANQVASLLNGQLDVGNGSITGVMAAVSKGIEVRVFSAVAADNMMDDHTLYDTLVADDSDINSFRDLEGKIVAVNSLKGTWEASVSEAIAKDGGDPALVEFVQLGFPDQVPALTNGHVDAIFTSQPFASTMLGQGFRSIGDAQAIALDNQRGVATILQASERFLSEKPDVAQNFIDALQEASEYANENPEEVRDLAVKLAGATGDAEASIRNAPLPFYTTEIDADGVESWGDLLVKFGYVETTPAASDVLWVAP